MYFVYCLQAGLIITSFVLGVWNFSNSFIKVILFLCVYIIHELLHVVVVYRIGDISLTHSGIFFWLTSGAVLHKLRFFIFMSLPFITLTVIPAVASIFLSGAIKEIAVYVSWVNSIIAGADIINSVLIAIKPNGSMFYRGYYKVS